MLSVRRHIGRKFHN